MNIYDAIAKDHRLFETQLTRLLAASKADDDQWKTTLDELRHSVIAHAHAEEAVLYNAMRETDAPTAIVLHNYAEHATAETEIRTLGAAKMIDANWTTLVEKLDKDLRHHIEEEESEAFAAARQVFSDDEASQLGAAFEHMKLAMAKDGDSIVASQVDLIVNLLPPRLTDMFRKGMDKTGKKAERS